MYTVYHFLLAGVEVSADHEKQMTFNSSMSKEDFYKWLRSRGISEEDGKTLISKYNNIICYYIYVIILL